MSRSDPKSLFIHGSTGSIGYQTLDVIRREKTNFKISCLSAWGSNLDRIEKQIAEFKPEIVHIASPQKAYELKQRTKKCRILSGEENILKIARGECVDFDMMVSAASGTAGLKPTIQAIKSGFDIALANKETLVSAGILVKKIARNSGSRIFPIDSEHSAIFQCLQGVVSSEVECIILTCSGGPFRNPEIDLNRVTPSDALAHPTWNMGKKISIDSATLMNKGLEIIEAHWLFDQPVDRIKVVIHPESIIHSMVMMKNGSVLAQMSPPDMKLPILIALNEGHHSKFNSPRLNLPNIRQLTFFDPDRERFPALDLAVRAVDQGGFFPAILNAANEIAVRAFIAGQIGFTDITRLVAEVMDGIILSENFDETELYRIDSETKRFTERKIKGIYKSS